MERSEKNTVVLKPVLRNPDLALSFCNGSKQIVSCLVRVKVFELINGSSRGTNKSQINTMMKQSVAINTWRSLRCRIIALEHWSKRKPTYEPRWAKQQTKNSGPNQLK